VRNIIFALLGISLAGALGAPVGAQTSPATLLFLLENNGSPIGAIHAFTLNSSTGALSEAPGSPYNAGFDPQQLAVDPTGRFLYATNQTSQDITGYSVDTSSGALTPLPGSPFFIGGSPIVMGLDPTGRFLYVFAATTTQNAINQESLFEYTIDDVSGALTLSSSSPTVWEGGPGDLVTSIAFNPIGNLAYLGQTPSAAYNGAILICAVDFTTGSLTQIGSAKPASAESDHLGVSPAGNFVYSTSRSNQSADVFTAGATGQLIEVSGSPYPVGNTPAAILAHPSGNFVYVVNENQPYQTNVNPSQYAGSISAFGVNAATGALTPISGSPFSAGINSSSIGVDPSGKFAYVTATTYTPGTFKGFAQILGFSIDPTAGVLTPFIASAWTDLIQGIGTQLAVATGASGDPNPAPTISSLSPSSVAATGPAFTLQINGAGFVQGCRAYFAGQPRATAFISSTQLNVSILASDIDNGGTAVVFVFNPLPGGGASSSLPFTITSAAPTITTLTPATVIAGSASLTISLMGSNFLTSSTVNFNGVAVPTIYITSTFIRGEVPPVNYASPGTGTITVTNPPNGSFPGGSSNALTLSVVAQAPKFAVTGISPSSGLAGGPAFTLTASGTGFVSGAQVSFGLANEPTTFVSSTQLTAAIPASAIAAAGNPYVIVTNPDGTQSTLLTFPVNNPAPGGNSVSPPSLPAGASALTLDVSGTGFIPPDANGVGGSTVFVNGTPRPTKFVSSTLLQATLLGSDLSQGGTLNITVVNPPPGGGISPAIRFMVEQDSLSLVSSNGPVIAGQTATFALTYASTSGTIPTAVNFAVSSISPHLADAAASFQPSATMPPGASPQSVTLSVKTQARASTSLVRFPRRFSPDWFEMCLLSLAVSMFGFWLWQWRGRMSRLAPQLLLALLLCVLGTLAACTGIGSAANSKASSGSTSSSQPGASTGTQAGNYTIIVTSTTAGVTHDVSVTLTVM
jgi:6-phosphogluconolactonase (cycloisomerase 2 family)